MKKALAVFLCLLMILPVTASAQDVYESTEDVYIGDCYLPYRLIVPEGYNEKYEYPLLVFFHGAGERGTDNIRQLNNCVQYITDNMPKAIILVPQCPSEARWVETDWGNGSYSVDEVPESAQLKTVIELVGELKKQYSIDSDCVYAAGISMGGYAVWDVMIRHNDIFAAGIAVCGAGDPSKAEVLKDTPMFVFHGDCDDTVPVSGSRDMVEAIEAAGGTQVEYLEYSGSGHGIWDMAFRSEGLLTKLQRYKLSDRYQPVDDPGDQGGQSGDIDLPQYLPYIFLGVAVLVAVVMVVVLLSGNKKKEDEEEKKPEE